MIDSDKQHLSTFDVIQQSLDATGHRAERGEHLRRLSAMLQHPNMHVHQFGNTVFTALEAQPGMALLGMHNADSPRNLVINTVHAMHWLKHTLGLHAVVFSTATPSIRALAERMTRVAGIPGMRLEHGAAGRDTLYLG